MTFGKLYSPYKGPIYLLISSSVHSQIHGQVEIVNKCLKTYLRCMGSDTPNDWSKWLSLATWWYNTTFHTTTEPTHMR